MSEENQPPPPKRYSYAIHHVLHHSYTHHTLNTSLPPLSPHTLTGTVRAPYRLHTALIRMYQALEPLHQEGKTTHYMGRVKGQLYLSRCDIYTIKVVKGGHIGIALDM